MSYISYSEEDLVRYTSAVCALASVDQNGDWAVGTCFHVGEGVFVTARHVVEGRSRFELHQPQHRNSQCGEVSSICLHPNKQVDVAVFRCSDSGFGSIELGGHLNDWMVDLTFYLKEVLVLGYPRIPLSASPVLVVTRGEVNAVVDLAHTPHPHFALSTMARGGFSGGPVISESFQLLGMVTSSLVGSGQPPETGFQVAVSVEPILNCLGYHRMAPRALVEFWNDHGSWSIFET